MKLKSIKKKIWSIVIIITTLIGILPVQANTTETPVKDVELDGRWDVKNTKTGQTESYTYDAENRLSKVSVTDKDGKTAVIQQNRYNGDGQRIQKVEGSNQVNDFRVIDVQRK